MQELFEKIRSVEFIGLFCAGSLIFLLLSPMILKRGNKALLKMSDNQIDKALRKSNFSPDVTFEYEAIDHSHKVTFLIDEKSKRIAYFIVDTKLVGGFINFSSMVDAHIKINEETVYSSPVHNSVDPYITYVDVHVGSLLKSIFIYIDSNKLDHPVYKLGYMLKNPMSVDNLQVKDLIDWYYKVYAAIKQIIKQYGNQNGVVQK